jgi:mannose-1-phosphate guanylyltransferase
MKKDMINPKMYRPWGYYEEIIVSNCYKVKHVTVRPGAAISLQYHHHRSEHWNIIKGFAKVTKGENEYFLKKDDSISIDALETHRIENISKIHDLDFIEVQTGKYLGEDDIIRLEDRYNRLSIPPLFAGKKLRIQNFPA